MLIYGKNTVEEVFKRTSLYKDIKKIYVQENVKIEIPKELSSFVQKSKKNELDHLSNGNHQGIIVSMASYQYKELSNILDEDPSFLIILDHLEDPHNLGAIIRTATAASCDAIIIPQDREVGVSSVVAKTSVGTVFDMNIVKVVNIKNTIDILKEKGFWIVGTTLSGQDYRTIDYSGKIALVIGNEGKGMSRFVQESCDFFASIPMKNGLDSLNASVAAGIMIYEVIRHRK